MHLGGGAALGEVPADGSDGGPALGNMCVSSAVDSSMRFVLFVVDISAGDSTYDLVLTSRLGREMDGL